ncbi:hypothetical protein JCM10049v2_003420 [Rhodotorula toruloides]
MSAQQLGQCIVCGVETNKRCSACTKVGHSLFFCSPEHQKLVWHNHRRICGSSLSPAPHPWLSKKEAAEAFANFDVLQRMWHGGDESVSTSMQAILKCRAEDAKDLLKFFAEGETHPYDTWSSQSVITETRNTEYLRKLGDNDLNDVLGNYDNYTVINQLWNYVLPMTPTAAQWYSEAHYRVAILLTLIQLQKTGNPAVTLDMCRQCFRQVEQCLLTAIAAKHTAAVPWADWALSRLRKAIDTSTMSLHIPLDTAGGATTRSTAG